MPASADIGGIGVTTFERETRRFVSLDGARVVGQDAKLHAHQIEMIPGEVERKRKRRLADAAAAIAFASDADAK